MNILHWIEHLFGSNTGHVVSGTDHHGLWIGFECHGCGKILGKHYAGDVVDRSSETD